MNFIDFKIFPIIEPDSLLKFCTGNNNKGLLVVIDPEDKDQEKIQFLTKILSAVQYDLDKDALLISITEKDHWSLMDLCNKLEKPIQKVLVFGLPPKSMGLNIEANRYEVVSIAEKKILFADSLNALQLDGSKKKSLWNNLKLMFGI